VGTAVTVLSNFDSMRWDADVYGAVALASRLSELVKNRALTVKLAYHLWKLNSTLASFFAELHKAIERDIPKGQPPVTPDRVRESAQSLRKLYASLQSIWVPAKRTGLTNNSLTAGALHSIHNYGEDILELAQLLELSLDLESIQSIYDRASAEKERGDIFDLSQVE
jgi:hypothetical protein